MRFVAAAFVIFAVLGWAYFLVSIQNPKHHSYIWLNEAGDKALVLFWTPYFGVRNGNPHKILSIAKKSYPEECFRNCEITFDRKRIKEAHAIVLHERDMKKSDMPEIRAASQLWVFLAQESPIVTTNILKTFPGVFNWTMTYRRDSDVFHPYAKIVPKHELNESSTRETVELNVFLAGKTKLVVGVISNCFTNSKRENVIKQLKKQGLTIDIFGKCGSPTCPRGGNSSCFESELWTKLGKEYKFYLAFENALCWDYVTEKFFRTLEYGLVPIVYGGADYNNIAPPNSFINVENFESPKELANFLKKLDKNQGKYRKYRKYFQWRKTFNVVHGDAWCTLCQKVRKHNLKRKLGKKHVPQSYDQLNEWWFNYEYHAEHKSACRKSRWVK
ncbi:Alpha-(1,3)-fucosyltransferase C [Orchesella cincta]|uniref:Fucosyltransferase n=1 Tax=Orchesella cincta TaxID=48709 RepID=A0A1D2MVK4_ORCCI|nr:Alpha-(1,3)-fucosyltransferase C [Orchesella cincta]